MRTKKAVITAAGYGTRLFPATKAVKKDLFPLVERDGTIKPIIQMVNERPCFRMCDSSDEKYLFNIIVYRGL